MTAWALLTLDTSCVSALANPRGTEPPEEVAALDRIVDAARDSAVRLQLTAAYERDVERLRDEGRRSERLAWLEQAPPMARVGGIFRLDVSTLGGPDVLGGGGDVDLDHQLRMILAPTVTKRPIPGHEVAPHAAAKAFSDIDHLIAHLRSGADAFVTLDVSTILNRGSALADLGIVVCRPSEALTHLAGSAK